MEYAVTTTENLVLESQVRKLLPTIPGYAQLRKTLLCSHCERMERYGLDPMFSYWETNTHGTP